MNSNSRTIFLLNIFSIFQLYAALTFCGGEVGSTAGGPAGTSEGCSLVSSVGFALAIILGISLPFILIAAYFLVKTARNNEPVLPLISECCWKCVGASCLPCACVCLPCLCRWANQGSQSTGTQGGEALPAGQLIRSLGDLMTSPGDSSNQGYGTTAVVAQQSSRRASRESSTTGYRAVPTAEVAQAPLCNSDGAPVHQSMDTSHTQSMQYYCGREVGQTGYQNPCGSCDGRCGPTNGCQCKSCYAFTAARVRATAWHARAGR